MIRIYCLVLIFFLTSLGFAKNQCANFYDKQYSSSAYPTTLIQIKPVRQLPNPTLEQIRQSVTAVHVTDHLPTNDLLKASLTDTGFRPTLHFSLGQMVVGHDYGSWENKKIAVLVPFQHLEPQLLNVFHQDTVILGNLKIQPGSTLILRSTDPIPNIEGVRIVTYDSNTTSLRKKIESVLREQGQWVFRATGGYTDNPVYYGNRKIDQKVFFESVFKEYPRVTFGLASSHPTGVLDHYLSAMSLLKETKYPAEYNVYELIFMKEQILNYISAVRVESTHLNKNSNAKKTLEKAIKQVIAKLNLLEADIQLQRQFLRSFLATPNLDPKLVKSLWSLANKPDELKSFVTAKQELFTKTTYDLTEVQNEVYHDHSLRNIREFMNPIEFAEFLTRESETADLAGGKEFQLRLQSIEALLKTANKTESQQKLHQAFKEELKICDLRSCRTILSMLLKTEYQNEMIQILRDSFVSKNLEQFFDLKAFTHLTTEDPSTWLWFAMELKKTKDKQHWWQEGLRLYGLREVSTE